MSVTGFGTSNSFTNAEVSNKHLIDFIKVHKINEAELEKEYRQMAEGSHSRREAEEGYNATLLEFYPDSVNLPFLEELALAANPHLDKDFNQKVRAMPEPRSSYLKEYYGEDFLGILITFE